MGCFPQKNRDPFEQASCVFAGPFAFSRFDNEHSVGEDRWILLGTALNQTVLVVVHKFRETRAELNWSELSAPEKPRTGKNEHTMKGFPYEG